MYCHHKLEDLTALFCRNGANLRDDPFQTDKVITQSNTMELYLNKSLADRKQITINIDYLHPRAAINWIFHQAHINCSDPELNEAILVWKIYALLPELEQQYQQLQHYFKRALNDQDLHRYQLAAVIARIFDYYMGYRGDWLEGWQQQQHFNLGEHEEWQAELWRRLTVTATPPLLFRRPTTLLAENLKLVAEIMPPQLTIFGISNLPADYIRFFAAIAEHTATRVDFYYLMPCLVYWADANRREALQKFANPLLASWAPLGRDFFQLLLESFTDGPDGGELPDTTIQPANALQALQHDILHNLPVTESALSQCAPLPDKTIVINSCHSRLREIEILYDYILHLLDKAHLKISDIVVMVPDIEAYTPYIEAHFALRGAQVTDNDDRLPAIPFVIADSSTLQSSIEADIFMKILDLADSKFSAQDIFDIIASEPVSKKFALTHDETVILHDMLVELNVAWGKDDKHRQSIARGPRDDNNTWSLAFKRLLNGYAFDCEALVNNDILPYPLDDARAILAGKLLDICKKLFSLLDSFQQPHSPTQWHNKLLEIIDNFFYLKELKNEQLQPIYDTLREICHNCSQALHDSPLPLSVIRCAIRDEFKRTQNKRSNFFRGGLTFCQLLPMRNIPFKAICIIGLNEAEFPRQESSYGFDLSRLDYRPGDRSPRKDDRYIFLETIMACREYLYLSYLGQSNNDNTTIPPSVLVSELLDYLAGASNISAQNWVTVHPLHGFNPAYFDADNPRLFSYSHSNCRAALAQMHPTVTAPRNTTLPHTDKVLEYSFEEFVRFFQAPTRFFLAQRLNIDLYNAQLKKLREHQPFEIDGLENYNINLTLLEAALQQRNLEEFKRIRRACGDIPYGFRGDNILEQSTAQTVAMTHKIAEFGEKIVKQAEQKIEFKHGDLRLILRGTFPHLYEGGQLIYRPGSIKPIHKLTGWLWHQLALAVKLSEQPHTTLLGYDKNEQQLQLQHITTSYCHLTQLSQFFLQGLQQPLPLFQHCSVEFAKRWRKIDEPSPTDETTCLKQASLKWQGSHDGFSEDLADDANRICFGEEPPPLLKQYQQQFVKLAIAVYGTVIEEVE